MNVRKFIAASARDALHKVKELLGPDAIILSNRAIPGGVEIMAVAARDMEMIVPTPTREKQSPNLNPKPNDDYTVRLSTTTTNLQPKAPPKVTVAAPQQQPQRFPPLAG